MWSMDRLLGTLSFVIATVAGMMIAACRLPKREHFGGLAVGFSLLVCAFRYALRTAQDLTWEQVDSPIVGWILVGFLPFLMCLLMIRVCYRTNIWGTLLCATSGYCMQFISRKTYELLILFTGTPGKLAETLIVGLITFVMYWPMWFFFFRRLDRTGAMLHHHLQICVSTLAIFCSIILYPFVIGDAVYKTTPSLQLSFGLMMIVLMLLVFFMECSIQKENSMLTEQEHLREIIEQQRVHYQKEKQDVELVNIRCHDIRHQLRAMKDVIDPSAMKTVTDAISVYDSNIETGNEAISMVFAKYSLYCMQKGIRLSCMVDGERLGYVPAYELYALFGNAVENAVNAVEKLEQEKRVISVTSGVTGNLLSLCFSNYFDGKIEMEDGVPVNRAQNHGFGVRSIRTIVNDLGGCVNFKVKDDLFVLEVLIPLKETAS